MVELKYDSSNQIALISNWLWSFRRKNLLSLVYRAWRNKTWESKDGWTFVVAYTTSTPQNYHNQLTELSLKTRVRHLVAPGHTLAEPVRHGTCGTRPHTRRTRGACHCAHISHTRYSNAHTHFTHEAHSSFRRMCLLMLLLLSMVWRLVMSWNCGRCCGCYAGRAHYKTPHSRNTYTWYTHQR
jgi:hypothetical protein